MIIGRKVPNDVTFNVRVRNDYLGGDNPYQWQEMTTDDYFKDKRISCLGVCFKNFLRD